MQFLSKCTNTMIRGVIGGDVRGPASLDKAGSDTLLCGFVGRSQQVYAHEQSR